MQDASFIGAIAESMRSSMISVSGLGGMWNVDGFCYGGIIQASHTCDPGSTPGMRILFFVVHAVFWTTWAGTRVVTSKSWIPPPGFKLVSKSADLHG